MLDFPERSDLPVGNSYRRASPYDHHDDGTERGGGHLGAIIVIAMGLMFVLSVIAGIAVG